MQNGAIGEARTKAFLIDRFWILERSVDVDGADFIVQIKLTEKDLLSNNIRFGRIQAKYVQDGNTPVRIKKNYFLDNNGDPRLDFFLIVNTGAADDQKLFLLNSSDIQRLFRLQKAGDYRGCYAKHLITEEFLVSNRQLALSRIENSIKSADFYRNRTYIFTSLDSVTPNFEGILPEYSEDIEYSEGRIPELFKEQKMMAFESILEIENIHGLLKRFVEAIDPIEGVYVAEELERNLHNGSLKIPEIFNRDFYYLLKNHLEIVNDLKKDGALDNFICAPREILSLAQKFIASQNIEFDERINHIIRVRYNVHNLKILEVVNKVERSDQKEFYEFMINAPGDISVSYRIGFQLIKKGSIEVNQYCTNLLSRKMYELKYN